MSFFTRLREHHPPAALYVTAVQQKMGNYSAGTGEGLLCSGECSGNSDLAMMVALGWDMLKSDQVDLAAGMARRALDVDKSVSEFGMLRMLWYWKVESLNEG